jgi:hypothetical protein
MLAQASIVETSEETLVIGQTGFQAKAWDFTSGAIPNDWIYGDDHDSAAEDFYDECWGTKTNQKTQIIYSADTVDKSKPVVLGMYVRPYNGTHNAKYTIYWGSTPSSNPNSATLTLEGTEYTFEAPGGGFDSGFDTGFQIGGSIGTDDAGYPPPGWFEARWDGTTINFTFRDIALGTWEADAENYFGVGAQSTALTGGTCIDAIRMEWHSATLNDTTRTRLAALCGGDLYIQSYGQNMVLADPDSGLDFADDRQLCATDYQQELVIADSGRLHSGTTGRLAATDFELFSDDDGTVFTNVTTDYVLSITDSNYTQNAKQDITISGATSGDFVLSYSGFSTTPITYGATAEAVQTELETLPGLKSNVSVSKLDDDNYTVTFIGALSEATVSILGADASALVPAPPASAITITLTQQGAGGTFIAGSYRIASVGTTTITLVEGPDISQATDVTEIEYSVDRPPKIYNPKTDVLQILEADEDKGQVPGDHPLVCVYRDRLVFAGAPSAPTSILMSRMGDIRDWNYGATDSAGAYAIVATADAGRTPEPIVAMIPHSDECVIFGCLQSLWILRGDPGFGGAVDNISYSIGIVGPKAWTRIPTGEIVFLGQDGLYIFPAGCHGKPTSLSSERIPEDLKCLNPGNATITLQWDIKERGLYIFVTRETGVPSKYYWLDWETKSFWPEAYQFDHEPFAAVQHYSPVGGCDVVYLGGRDGRIRYFEPKSDLDDGGSAIDSYAVLGPFRIASSDHLTGMINELTGVLATNSGDVDWEIKTDNSHTEVINSSTIKASGTWNRAGLNYKVYPRKRGFAGTLTLRGGEPRRWAMERIQMVLRDAGKLRILEDRSTGTELPPTGLTNDGDVILTNDSGAILESDGM